MNIIPLTKLPGGKGVLGFEVGDYTVWNIGAQYRLGIPVHPAPTAVVMAPLVDGLPSLEDPLEGLPDEL